MDSPSPSTNITFVVNDTFDSFESLEKKIEKYSQENFIVLYHRDTRTLEGATSVKKISTERGTKNPSLKYYELKYTCNHGGKLHKPLGRGKRATNTFKQACPFNISLRLSRDGMHLVVTGVHLHHENHDIGYENYRFYPKVRKLDADETKYAENMLNMGANNKKLQHQLVQETGKSVTLKDLRNISQRAKLKKHTTKNDLNECIGLLRNKHNCSVNILKDQNETFCGLFVQDREMRETFAAFPEILFLDATYKLLELSYPVYIFLCEDSNGMSEIVGLGMLVTEDEESLKWLIDTFKLKNPSVMHSRLVMADKDINERHVIKEVLPHLRVLICLFHSLRTFKREISTEKMGINVGEREACLEFIQKMAYAKSEDEYNRIYLDFVSCAPKVVKEYFDKNWHGINDEWVMGFKFSTGNFLNSTNNRLEAINGKLKQVITRNTTMEFFIDEFFIILPCLRELRNYQTVYSYQSESESYSTQHQHSERKV